MGAVNPNAMMDSRYVASMEDIYDLYTVPTKTSMTAVLEFITDCYAAQWGSMLRNGGFLRDSFVLDEQKFSWCYICGVVYYFI